MCKKDLDNDLYELKKSLENNPSNPDEIHKNMAIIYLEKGMEKEATGEFQEVIRLRPEDPQPYEYLGKLSVKRDKPLNAIRWFTCAGDLYLKKNEINEAIRIYKYILELDSHNKEAGEKLEGIYRNY